MNPFKNTNFGRFPRFDRATLRSFSTRPDGERLAREYSEQLYDALNGESIAMLHASVAHSRHEIPILASKAESLTAELGHVDRHDPAHRDGLPVMNRWTKLKIGGLSAIILALGGAAGYTTSMLLIESSIEPYFSDHGAAFKMGGLATLGTIVVAKFLPYMIKSETGKNLLLTILGFSGVLTGAFGAITRSIIYAPAVKEEFEGTFDFTFEETEALQPVDVEPSGFDSVISFFNDVAPMFLNASTLWTEISAAAICGHFVHQTVLAHRQVSRSHKPEYARLKKEHDATQKEHVAEVEKEEFGKRQLEAFEAARKAFTSEVLGVFQMLKSHGDFLSE